MVRGFIIWKEGVKEVVLWKQKFSDVSFSDKRFCWHETIQESGHSFLCGCNNLVTSSAEYYTMQKYLKTNRSAKYLNLGGGNAFATDPFMKSVNLWFTWTTECFIINERMTMF